jgi:transposase
MPPWLAIVATDMRRSMNGLAPQVRQLLGRDPPGSDLYVDRGRGRDLIKVLWHDGHMTWFHGAPLAL